MRLVCCYCLGLDVFCCLYFDDACVWRGCEFLWFVFVVGVGLLVVSRLVRFAGVVFGFASGLWVLPARFALGFRDTPSGDFWWFG